jgi:FlaA1/EpsC-like NDP-sugar epimerase
MRNRYLLIADLVAIVLAAWAAFAFRFGWLFTDARVEFTPFLVLAVLLKVSAFLAFGIYSRYWRYAGFWDLMTLVLANSAASVALAIVMVGARLLDLIPGLSRPVLPLDWIFALGLTVGLRASLRAIAETVSRQSREKREAPQRDVLIVGAGDAGAMVAKEMQRNPQLGLRPIGFLDDDPVKGGKQIYGLFVLGGIEALRRVAERRRVDEVVIAVPTAGGPIVRSIAERCRELGIPSRVMPGIFELLDGHLNVSRLRNVDIADLLRRPQVKAHSASPSYLAGVTVLVTGAGGSIGSELSRQVAYARPAMLVLLGHGENSIFEIAGELRKRFPDVPIRAVIADVRDRERLMRTFKDVSPSVVFHAAAHKHVPLMEDNAAEAVTNNVVGTRNVIDAALSVGVARLVMVSTDKAAAPSSMMGASKRVAEAVVRHAAKAHDKPWVVVRFGNVLGSRGSVVPTFKAQIEAGGPVTVTHPDVRRYFMTIPESVHLILQAGGIGRGGELFVLEMGRPVRLHDMAADMIRLSGFSEDEIPIVFTGLRPGEKLDEILWEDDAMIEQTESVDIRRVTEPHAIEASRLDDLVARLSDAAARDDSERIARLIREHIPTATVESRPRSGHLGVVVPMPRTPHAG